MEPEKATFDAKRELIRLKKRIHRRHRQKRGGGSAGLAEQGWGTLAEDFTSYASKKQQEYATLPLDE